MPDLKTDSLGVVWKATAPTVEMPACRNKCPQTGMVS